MLSVGLVLEGGGMRGLYTAGVLDAFLDAGIKIDGIVSYLSLRVHCLVLILYLDNERGLCDTIKSIYPTLNI